MQKFTGKWLLREAWNKEKIFITKRLVERSFMTQRLLIDNENVNGDGSYVVDAVFELIITKIKQWMINSRKLIECQNNNMTCQIFVRNYWSCWNFTHSTIIWTKTFCGPQRMHQTPVKRQKSKINTVSCAKSSLFNFWPRLIKLLFQHKPYLTDFVFRDERKNRDNIDKQKFDCKNVCV